MSGKPPHSPGLFAGSARFRRTQGRSWSLSKPRAYLPFPIITAARHRCRCVLPSLEAKAEVYGPKFVGTHRRRVSRALRQEIRETRAWPETKADSVLQPRRARLLHFHASAVQQERRHDLQNGARLEGLRKIQ
ncbi:hypothetical protein GUJ93_ZPchr0004g38393 [Zizania palustris]|uniref:Uncharacterized protein n=1 Tax=Zizania palustris TaxID=103762 RepID=A0A8J5SK45_ZIZPA|nr:hypothetical protein GUJ93_ZPchr0004g38393 [Zizania palustris]